MCVLEWQEYIDDKPAMEEKKSTGREISQEVDKKQVKSKKKKKKKTKLVL